MNNFEEIVANQQNEQSFEETNYSKNNNNWKDKKRQERDSAYELIDKTADQLRGSSEFYNQWLNVQSNFESYSVGNSLLILAQMPEATQVKSYSDWKKDTNILINKPYKQITILEPYTYTKDDKTITNYNAKKVIDISQTNAKPRDRKSIDEDMLLKALIKSSPVPVKAVDSLPDNKKLEYNKEEKTLSVVKGLEYPLLFHVLTKGLAQAELDDTSDMANFKSYGASYLICKRNGVNVNTYNFSDSNSMWEKLDVKQVREELGSIRNTMEKINARVDQYFEQNSRTPKNKTHER